MVLIAVVARGHGHEIFDLHLLLSLIPIGKWFVLREERVHGSGWRNFSSMIARQSHQHGSKRLAGRARIVRSLRREAVKVFFKYQFAVARDQQALDVHRVVVRRCSKNFLNQLGDRAGIQRRVLQRSNSPSIVCCHRSACLVFALSRRPWVEADRIVRAASQQQWRSIINQRQRQPVALGVVLAFEALLALRKRNGIAICTYRPRAPLHPSEFRIANDCRERSTLFSLDENVERNVIVERNYPAAPHSWSNRIEFNRRGIALIMNNAFRLRPLSENRFCIYIQMSPKFATAVRQRERNLFFVGHCDVESTDVCPPVVAAAINGQLAARQRPKRLLNAPEANQRIRLCFRSLRQGHRGDKNQGKYERAPSLILESLGWVRVQGL